MRAVLNALPSAALVVVMVAGMVGLALLAVATLRRRPHLADSSLMAVGEEVRGVYEALYGLILAFVIGSVLQNFAAAQATVADEATTLEHLKRANAALSPDAPTVLDDALSDYTMAVVEEEFPRMRHGEESPEAAAALGRLYAVYQAYDLSSADDVAREFFRDVPAQLDELAADRRARLAESTDELPGVLRVFLPMGALVLLAIELRPKMPVRAQALHISLVAGLLSFAYALTIIMDYPFSGDLSVSPGPYMSGALAELWR